MTSSEISPISSPPRPKAALAADLTSPHGPEVVGIDSAMNSLAAIPAFAILSQAAALAIPSDRVNGVG